MRTCVLAVAGLLAAGSLVAADGPAPWSGPAPAGAAVRQGTLTARVTAIEHARGRVALGGTAVPGSQVFVGGDLVAPEHTRAAPDGSWHADVGVGAFDHVLRIASDHDWTPVDVPVTVLVLNDLDWEAVQHGGTVDLDAVWQPGARVRLTVDGAHAATIVADPAGRWHHRVTGLPPGEHRLEAVQRFDGAVNGRYAQDVVVDG